MAERRRNTRKRELYTLVGELFDQGIRSTTLLAAALNVSDETARRALIVLGKLTPRRDKRDVLAGVTLTLRRRCQVFAMRAHPDVDSESVEVPHNREHDQPKVA